jgi:hypothetical protein
MNRPALFILLCVLLMGSRGAAAEDWPEIPAPPHSKLEWVADSMRINGVPTRVLRFDSQSTAAEVVAYYRSYWTGGYAHPPSITSLGPATVVGQRHGPFFMTVKVQATDNGKSTGLIATSQVVGIKVTRDPGELPLMPGAQVYSVVESDDPGKHSREVIVQMSQPPSSVAHFYQTSLTNDQWHQLQDTETPVAAGVHPGNFLVFGRDQSEFLLSIVAAPGGRGSTLVANLVTKDTGPGLN